MVGGGEEEGEVIPRDLRTRTRLHGRTLPTKGRMRLRSLFNAAVLRQKISVFRCSFTWWKSAIACNGGGMTWHDITWYGMAWYLLCTCTQE